MFLVQDLGCAQVLKASRLLTSSLRHEPAFKQDDPDQVLAQATKKTRFVEKFNFEQLLPLLVTLEECKLAVELGLVLLRCLVPNHSFLVELNPTNRPQVFTWSSPKYACFKRLWELGYTMVDGLKYGVDYLAYSQDPLRHHAEYMVLIDNLTSPVDLIALATVAGKAKKQLLVVNYTTNQVEFTQLMRRPVNLKKSRKRRQLFTN
ncbi:hypothetical protein BASA81_003666 [Batrachochytrium salamandrivorans]|nr:hypothetical protein BASA81_003666 [Batrachochytrium salamandrivorans]